MRTSSLRAVALSVLSLVAVSDASQVIESQGENWFGAHDMSKTLEERQLITNVCRDLGRVNGTTYVCMASTNTVISAPNCDAFDFIREQSFCCNKSLSDPEGVLPLPLASQNNCCPATPVEYKNCGVPPTMLCCHPTEQRCIEPTTPGVDFGQCEDISKAPTTGAPTQSPTGAPTSTPRPTGAPTTGAPTTSAPTTSPTSSDFLVCPTEINGDQTRDLMLLPLQDASGFVHCGCSSTCPSNSHCTFQTDPSTNVTDGYCCPDIAVAGVCNSHDCETCNNDTACDWFAMQGCQLKDSLTNAEAACHICPSNATAPVQTPSDIKTGVPGSCMRRCGYIGGKRYFTDRTRELEFTAAINSADDPTRWLYNPPNPYNPYFNLYGSGFVPAPPQQRPVDRLDPMSPESCSCDDACAKVANADCCNDYQDLCVF